VDQSDNSRPARRRGRPPGRRPTRTEGDRLWDVADVADFFKVAEAWVYDKAASGALPVIRLPGSVFLRFDPAVIRALIKTA
jgi:hypothetical protein